MRPCPLCKHASLNDINRRMVAGTDAAEIAREFKVPHRAAMHHKRYHLPRLLQKAHEGEQSLEAVGLRQMLAQIGADFQSLFEEFMKAKDHRAALIAREKMLAWWVTAARMIGIAEPPAGHQEKPIDIAQAVRDLYGISEAELPLLDGEPQPALPPADATPEGPETENETPEPKPAQEQGHWEAAHDPNIEEKIRRATPVKNLYRKRLEEIHREGRRAEVGELSPRNIGQEVDLSACEQKAPPARLIGDGQLACPARNCSWSGPGASYAEHWATAHGKPV